MAEKIIVGVGTQVQVVINMTPIVGDDGKNNSLFSLDWSCEFVGEEGSLIIPKDSATKIDDNAYEVLVDTTSIGATEDMLARLTVKDIPTATGKRREVTPIMFTGIEVM